MRAEICKINQHLSKVLYFTVLLHILQCAQVTYIMLTHHMKALATYSNFYLKITRKCVENQHRKSDQHFLPPRPVLRDIWAPKNRSKIIPKSQKIVFPLKKVAVALPKPPRRLQNPPQASKKAPEASADVSKSFKNESKKPQDGKIHTPIHNSLRFAVNSNIPYAKIALPVCCPSSMIRTRLLTRNNSMFAAQR